MEKRKPSHDLAAFQAFVATPERLSITATATASAFALGFDRRAIAAALRALTRKHFYKSMTSYANPRAWQDVYHLPYGNMVLYIKFTDDAVTQFTVLSFKEKDDA